jgi:hypothetical protein
MNSKLNRWSAGIAWLQKQGFKVVDASGPNGTYQNLIDFDRRTLGQGGGRVTAQAIGAEGQDGKAGRVTAQAIGAEGHDGFDKKPGRVTAQALGAETQAA